MIWRWLANRVVPASAVRWGGSPILYEDQHLTLRGQFVGIDGVPMRVVMRLKRQPVTPPEYDEPG